MGTRRWFVAAVPERAAAKTVAEAKVALQPRELRDALKKVHRNKRDRRRNEAFVRQGEWFFIPAPGFDPARHRGSVLERNAPISRGWRSTPHVAQELCRVGGVTVYELRRRVEGRRVRQLLSADEFGALSAAERRSSRVAMRTRDAVVHV